LRALLVLRSAIEGCIAPLLRTSLRDHRCCAITWLQLSLAFCWLGYGASDGYSLCPVVLDIRRKTRSRHENDAALDGFCAALSSSKRVTPG
jgi:hypothetical protein